MATAFYPNPVSSVQGRIAPAYNPARDRGSYASRIAGMFSDMGATLSEGAANDSRSSLDYANAQKTLTETDLMRNQDEGRRVFGQRLAQAFSGSVDPNAAVQELASTAAFYNLPADEAARASAFALTAMPDDNPQKEYFSRVLESLFPVYSGKALGFRDAADPGRAQKIVDQADKTDRYQIDQQVGAQRYNADRQYDATVESARIRAEADVAGGAGGTNAQTKPVTRQHLIMAAGAVESVVDPQNAAQRAKNPTKKDQGNFRADLAGKNPWRTSPEMRELESRVASRIANGEDPVTAAQSEYRDFRQRFDWDGVARAFVPVDAGSDMGESVIGGPPPADMPNPVDVPRVTSAEDWKRLRPGQAYIDPNGVYRVKGQ